ncbi:MAG: DUF1330 domain-containing protein [Chloroflexi bacterium]|nr:DUF1330 domain-containing protein [Chloroflexota bacterium]
MAFYLVAEIEVHDPVGYEEYRALVAPIIEKFGGRYVVRGGEVLAGEGGWEPERVVILEFPSHEVATAWATSEEYAPVAEIRHRCATSRSFGVEGYQA